MFEMENCKEVFVLIATNCYVDLDEVGQQVDLTKYRGLISFLSYLTTSRPDIQFSVCLCVRFQSTPKESHYKAAKKNSQVSERNNQCWIMISK